MSHFSCSLTLARRCPNRFTAGWYSAVGVDSVVPGPRCSRYPGCGVAGTLGLTVAGTQVPVNGGHLAPVLGVP